MLQRFVLPMGAVLFVLVWGCGSGGGEPRPDLGAGDSSMLLDGSLEDAGEDATTDADVDHGAFEDLGVGTDLGSTTDSGTPEDAGPCPGPDTDQDGVPDECDICSAGPDSADSDGDRVPNACDICALGADQLDSDIDTVPNACDQCAGFSDLVDTDGDGVADGCDICSTGDDEADMDNDGVPDACDSCDLGPNGVDTDGDGTPNGCDVCPGFPDTADSDADGVPNGCDICPGHDDSMNTDGDGVPNGCDVCAGHDDDADSDGDDVPNGCDICAGHDDGVDTDMDTAPDGCDCEPAFPEARPGLTEVCDGLDNDCDGTLNDGLVGCTFRCPAGRLDWDLDGATCEATGRVIYVDVDAAGSADGTSWEDAYLTIEAAILDAEAAPLARRQIWVAEGEYTVSRTLGTGPFPPRVFLLPASTALLGGFSGDELSASAAAPSTHVVTLNAQTLADRIFDVRQSDVVIDGFTTSSVGGHALVVTSGGLRASRLNIVDFPPMVAYGAPAITSMSGNVFLEDVSIRGSRLGLDAQGGTLVCSRCWVRENGTSEILNAGPPGGVVVGGASVTLRNSAIVANRGVAGSFIVNATGNAGGVTARSSGVLLVEGTTIAGNTGGRILSPSSNANAGLDAVTNRASVINSVIQGNDGADDVVATVVSSSVEGRPGACAPLLTPDFRLGAGSACIDAGDASMTMGALDLAGVPRIRGATVDLGAYESPP